MLRAEVETLRRRFDLPDVTRGGMPDLAAGIPERCVAGGPILLAVWPTRLVEDVSDEDEDEESDDPDVDRDSEFVLRDEPEFDRVMRGFFSAVTAFNRENNM